MSPQTPGFFLCPKKGKKYMNKIIFVFMFIISLLGAGNVIAKETAKISENISAPEKADKRIKVLEAYLTKYNSPLKGEAKNFIGAADEYKIDWKLVPAITGVESTFGKFTPGNAYYPSYNGWGWGVYGTQALYFKSWKEGIYTVSEGLRLHYYNQGLTNPYDINRVYAASPTWGAHVSYFIADIEKFEKEYVGKSGTTALNQPDIDTQIAGVSAERKI